MSLYLQEKNGNKIECKNRYSLFEFFTLGISYIFTKLFYRGAKLICYPIYMRGKQSLHFEEGLNVGYGCRFDLINTRKKTLFIGKNCEFGDYCHIVATNSVIIGNEVLFASKIFISDTTHGLYNDDSSSSCPSTSPNKRILYADEVYIGDNVWVGDNVVILPGSRIGNGCIVGANSVVNKRFPDNCIIAGIPARIIKKYDEKSLGWIKEK